MGISGIRRAAFSRAPDYALLVVGFRSFVAECLQFGPTRFKRDLTAAGVGRARFISRFGGVVRDLGLLKEH
uniref:Uncharacterized protein n=1 Tax=Anopheles minimus TaxID=112268 RepID=A0A182W040_9DIPT